MPSVALRRPPGAALLRAFAALALLVVLAIPAAAQPQPQRVSAGMYVVNLSSLDLRSGTYSADFYLWVLGDSSMDGTSFELMNGSGDPCSLAYRRDVGTQRYNVYRCLYVFHDWFDLSEYPLDKHELTMELEDKVSPATQLVYVPDRKDTAIDSVVSLTGWVLEAPRLDVRTHVYTRMGDPTRNEAEARYSRLVLSIPIHRGGTAVYLKSFLVMFLSVLVGLMASALECRHVEARLGIGVASIFGVVTSYLVVTQALPETSQVTLADKLHLVGMAFVFISILITVTVYRYCEHMEAKEAERRDRIFGMVAAAAFVTIVALVTVLR